MKVFWIVILYFSLNVVRAQTCDQIKSKLFCEDSTALIQNKSMTDLSEIRFIQDFNQSGIEKKCQVGASNDVELEQQLKWEASRIAPLLQKLQSIKEARKIKKSSTGDIDKVEKMILRSSFFNSSQHLEKMTQQIKSKTVWTPRDMGQPINALLIDIKSEYKSSQYIQNANKDLYFSSRVPSVCLAQDPKMKLLKVSGDRDSWRSYQFKKAILDEVSAVRAAEIFKKCLAPPANSTQLCANDSVQKMKMIEKEIEGQICAVKELYPTVGSQLNSVSLEIPSAAGDLVTEGPGDRPTVAEAKSDRFKWNVICPEDLSLGGLARGMLGAASGFATHELSHEVTGRVLGKKLEWDKKSGTWTCRNCSEQIKPIAMAGLLSHNVSSEIIVNNQDNDSQFQKGWLFFNFINTATYFGKDWLARSGKVSGSGYATGTADKKGAGDLRAFSNKESYVLGALMIGHQLFSGYRYLKNRQNYQCKEGGEDPAASTAE
ncbi:MAG: hypothetical protein A2622_02765 [Bdellovibrionales bacterium RIFCSPHIGHO2_01_FULL_40_29]|nr:MAG: hypothetical protein A2622_02765 [Bdellovibrionales bacterium RIFCSPHIGHO2_01_FULL_40_29]OFZ34000.1 MAG: hypothetical protein A3D17_03185 [Bdellovibrionales bacterium RIFCSPHIGHO2_02_FULL_40_15]